MSRPTITLEEAKHRGYTPAMGMRFVKRAIQTENPQLAKIERILQQLWLKADEPGKPYLEAWVDVPLEDEK